MDNFKKILDSEKKYDHVLNTTSKQLEKEKNQFLKDLKIKEEATISDYKKELEEDYIRTVEKYNKQAEDILKDASLEVENLKKNANIEKAKQVLMEAIKNV